MREQITVGPRRRPVLGDRKYGAQHGGSVGTVESDHAHTEAVHLAPRRRHSREGETRGMATRRWLPGTEEGHHGRFSVSGWTCSCDETVSQNLLETEAVNRELF